MITPLEVKKKNTSVIWDLTLYTQNFDCLEQQGQEAL